MQDHTQPGQQGPELASSVVRAAPDHRQGKGHEAEDRSRDHQHKNRLGAEPDRTLESDGGIHKQGSPHAESHRQREQERAEHVDQPEGLPQRLGAIQITGQAA
ncbi:hypothetical protein D9M71_716600 [compost metagenome]